MFLSNAIKLEFDSYFSNARNIALHHFKLSALTFIIKSFVNFRPFMNRIETRIFLSQIRYFKEKKAYRKSSNKRRGGYSKLKLFGAVHIRRRRSFEGCAYSKLEATFL